MIDRLRQSHLPKAAREQYPKFKLRPPTDGLNGEKMVYRAKITKIQAWVDNNYNINAFARCRDAKDVYIEVKDEDEAELLESINRKQEELLQLIAQWYDKYEV